MKPVYVGCGADLRAIPVKAGQTTAQVKADGEFSLIHMDRNQIYAVNRFGRKTEDLPALAEMHKKFLSRPLVDIEVLGEMYAVDEQGRPLSLPNFIHYLKGGDESLHERIHIGLFDIVSADGIWGKSLAEPKRRFEILSRNFDGKLVHVLEWFEPTDEVDLAEYYVTKVEKEGWEGLVVRTNGDTYKAKPNHDIDAVIFGINKNNKGYAKGLAKSVKVALLLENGSFVELGDATVPSEAEARELFALTRVKVNENASTAFVKPLVVVRISYISLFPNTTNRIYKLLLGGFTEVGTMQAVRMKSPRVVGYRKDKKVCTEDIGMNQIGE